MVDSWGDSLATANSSMYIQEDTVINVLGHTLVWDKYVKVAIVFLRFRRHIMLSSWHVKSFFIFLLVRMY